MNELLNKMFVQIIDSVQKSKKSQQRHKKVFVDKTGTSVALSSITDPTITHFKNQYQNSNKGFVVGQIIGQNGTDVSLNCFSDQVKSDVIFKELVKQELVPKAPSNVIANYKKFLDMQIESKKFVDENKDFLLQPKLEEQEATQIEYQSRISLPENLNQYLLNVSVNEKRKILALILDVELRALLNKNVSSDGKAIVDQFLKNRQGTFQSQLSDEMQMELQEYETDSITDRDKCVLTFFYNIQKALGINDTDIYQAPDNIKQLTIGKGVDRSKTYLFPHYATLVGPERVKVCARRSMTLFSSGLAKITKGISNKLNNKQAQQFVQGGATTIFNVANKDGTRCFQDGTSLCDRFSEGKESAASAILMMYMEFMDYMINPSPPLILRNHMRVDSLYDNKPYDEENYPTWEPEKKAKFRQDYLKFCAKYMNVGFTFGTARGSHGMLLLNLDSWGEGDVVVNPFRVKEDAILFKYFGDFRLQPNRLGIGQHARKVWLNHKIKYDFDPVYCDAFKKHHKNLTYYPRPIFDINYLDDRGTTNQEFYPRFSDLYCNVPFNVPNGPAAACARRTYLDSKTMEQWIKMDPIKFQNDVVANLPTDPIWSQLAEVKQDFSRESLALWNIHENFRTSNFNPKDPFQDVKFANNLKYQITLPVYDTNEGSKMNLGALKEWKDVVSFPKSQCYTTANDLYVPLEATLPPPHLQDPLLHPVYNKHVDKKAEWSDTGDRAFAYPLDDIEGKSFAANVFPVGERKKSETNVWHKYKQRATTIYEIFPKAETEDHEVWDLRIALICLMGSRASLQVQEAIKMIETTTLKIESIKLKDINDIQIRNLCSLPKSEASAFASEMIPLEQNKNCAKSVRFNDEHHLYSPVTSNQLETPEELPEELPKSKELSEELSELKEPTEKISEEEEEKKHDTPEKKTKEKAKTKTVSQFETVNVNKKSKLKGKKNYFLVRNNADQSYFDSKQNSKIEINMTKLSDSLVLIQDALNAGHKLYIPVDDTKKSVLFNEEELKNTKVQDFINSLAEMANPKKSKHGKPHKSKRVLKLF